jgi:hypothetical protein
MSQEFYTNDFSIEGSLQTTANIVTLSNFVSGSQNLSELFADIQSYNSLQTTVQSNSAGWGGQTSGILEGLSGAWQSTYTDFSAQSANNISVYSTVLANSASWAVDSTADTEVRNLTSLWDSTFTTVSSNSAKWESVYSNVLSNSASYTTIDFANSKFFPLTGGQITGNTRINGNVTIFGDLTSTGTQTFANTIFSTTSSLSVVHVGSGPAVWVGNNGSGDIASFYDMDQGVEVLHVGGANGDFPNVGVKTSSPNKDFTVNGEISATSDIWTTGRIMSGDQELASIFRPDIDKGLSVFNTVQTNSATNWNYQGTDLKDLSAGWVGGNEAFTNLVANSAAYLSAVDLSFLSVSANWNSAYNTVQSNSATSWNYQGTDLKGLSANWQDTYTTVQSNSASWAVDSTIDTEVRALTSNWQNTYTDFSAQSANNISVYTTVQTNSATYVKTVATTTPGTSSVSTIVAVSALPVSPDPNTLYIVI